MSSSFGILEILLVLSTAAVYFIPTIIAIARRTRSISGIILVNVFTGWTFIGWVIALVWSIRNESKPAQVMK